MRPSTAQLVSEREFAHLGSEWADLQERARLTSPMMSWAWMYSWWETYRHAPDAVRRLELLAVRNSEGRLIALAPFLRRRAPHLGWTVRRLEMLGTGEREADETCAEMLDVLLDPQHAEWAATAIAQYWGDHCAWEEIVVRDVRGDRPSAFATVLQALQKVRPRLQVETSPSGRAPWVLLPESWEAYLQTLTRNSRQIIRAKCRRAEAAGAVYHSTEHPDEIRALLPVLQNLHQQRWQSQGRSGCFASPLFTQFLHRLTERMIEVGGVRLAYLRFGDTPAAVYYLLRHQAALYYYNSGVDTDRFGQWSPGTVCQARLLEEAIPEGFREYHFLKGSPDSYKYHWTREAIPLYSITVFRPSCRRLPLIFRERMRTLRRHPFFCATGDPPKAFPPDRS